MRQKSTLNSRHVVIKKVSRASGPVVRAFNILKCISDGTYTLSDISKKCNMSNSTTYGLLKKLKQSYAVISDPITHHYYLGQLIPQLASNHINTHQYLIACSAEEMKDLAAYTQVTITLDVLVGLKAYRINMVHGNHPLRITDSRDDPDIEETFMSAPGKVLYSQLNEDILRKICKFVKPHSLKSPEATLNDVMVEIKKIHRQGYAVSSGIRLQGVSCLSVPIFNYSGPVALNVIGPSESVKSNITRFAEKALKKASDISKKLKAEM